MRFAHSELLEWLNSGITVVTPDSLTAAVIQQQYAAVQLQAGRLAWSQPRVQPWTSFLEQTWRELRYRLRRRVPVVLSGCQERLLWEEAVERSEVKVLDVAATAQSAVEAYRFVSDWQLPLEDMAWEQESDSATFLNWLREIKRRCEKQNWLLEADLPWFLVEQASHLKLSQQQFVFAGFEPQPTKAALHLTAKFEEAGATVRWAEARKKSSPLLSVCAADRENELQLAARWARARLEEKPGASIAIYVDDLDQHRSTVERIFRDVLQPGNALAPVSTVAGTRAELPCHVHSAAPLSAHPVITAAFALLDFALSMVPVNSISRVFNSPFFVGGSAERSRRAVAESRLRSLREMELPLSAVEKYSAECPLLQEIWPLFRVALNEMPRKRGEPAQWSTIWKNLLRAAGWPGSKSLTPLEKTAVRQWQSALDSFESLGLARRSLSAAQALDYLRSLTTEEGPRSGSLLSPIQILEPQSAVSFRFDYAWLVGGSELAWPPAWESPAYVPLSLQRTANVLSAAAGGRRERACRLTEAIEASASTVVISFSGDQAVSVRLSPFFAKNRQIRSHEDLHPWARKCVADQIKPSLLQETEDWQAPPLSPSKQSSGGTYLLRSQSQCPFQAFARWRLSACGLDESVFSFDAGKRGDFLHKALASVWTQIKNSDRLHQLPPEELRRIVAESVHESLASDAVATPFRDRLRKAEAERLQKLILQWLQREKERPERFEVQDLEHEFNVQLDGLSLRLRTDRIDRLENGHLVVIDYKSGKVDRKTLDGERPKEPQLLVYAAMLGSNVDGLYFASVRREEGGPDGYGIADFFGTGEVMDPVDWQAQLKHWSETVTKLASEYQHGYAAVAPLKGACDFCDMKPICRILEDRSNSEEAE